MKGLPVQAIPLTVIVHGPTELIESLGIRPDLARVFPADGRLEVTARLYRADVLLVDASENPPAAYETLRALNVDTPVLALTRGDDSLAAIAAGASGVLSVDSSPDLILGALAALHQGLAVFDRSFLANLVPPEPSEETSLESSDDVATLTAREQEVLDLLAEGLSNREIGLRLDISEHTAKFHVNSILQKMGAQKRVEAVVRAAKLGIIDL